VESVLKQYPRLHKSYGKKVFELKPAIQWGKGRAVEYLLRTLGMTADNAVVLYIGDDLTDEAVFQVLRRPNVSIAICDGDRPTAADYSLQDCDDVKHFLDWLAQLEVGRLP